MSRETGDRLAPTNLHENEVKYCCYSSYTIGAAFIYICYCKSLFVGKLERGTRRRRNLQFLEEVKQCEVCDSVRDAVQETAEEVTEILIKGLELGRFLLPSSSSSESL